VTEELDELKGGWRRALSTARMGTKLAAKSAGRMLFRGKQPRDDDDEAAIADAKKLVARIGSLKGLAMKVGQIASYMPGGLPPRAQEVLAELQATSQPMAWSRIAQVIDNELGARAFASIDEAPFAAASIGQVHRARHLGAAVAVKVQYPGIEDAIRADLKTVGVIARLSTIGSPLDGKALAGELRDRLLEECDYAREADSQALFARLLEDVPGASVPRVIASRSTRRVLTTELVSRARLPEMAARADEAARDRSGATIFRAAFDLLFRHAIYNADPHPGNYLVADDGAVTFLDFGCIRRFDPQMIATWKRLAAAVLAGDRAGFAERFRELGFVGKEKGFDWDYQWDAMRFMYSPYLEPGFRFAPEFVGKTFGVLMFDNPNRFRIAMPPEWLFLNRLQWGLFAVLAQLRASAPWRDILETLIAAPIVPA
jgi:predicted unusual protein kinase regulating ubiquinone biosynthesis (AarF/ABC1/UbiB family)